MDAWSCGGCQADLREQESVRREYVDKDGGEPVICLGHYGPGDFFQPDHDVSFGDGRYDLPDDSDHCVKCDELV